jgi:hypothetical protein
MTFVVASAALAGIGLSTGGNAYAGTNGQQVCVHVPRDRATPGTGVHITGYNQNGQWRQWDGQLFDYGNGNFEACTWGWWWKGGVEVTQDGRDYRHWGYVPDLQFSDVVHLNM